MTPGCKVAVITGGAGGIGMAIAHKLLSNKAKYVALIGKDANEGKNAVSCLNDAYGQSRTSFMICDVQNINEVDAVLKKVATEVGKIDIMINAAGVWLGSAGETEIKTNLIGTSNTYTLSSKYMNKPGIILNIAGIHGIQPLEAAPTLTAAFHGVVGLTRSAGAHVNFLHTQIRVVCLCTGITRTDFIRDVGKRVLFTHMKDSLEEYFNRNHCQRPEACAEAALLLIKHASSGGVWVVEGSKLYLFNFVDWKKSRTLSMQFF